MPNTRTEYQRFYSTINSAIHTNIEDYHYEKLSILSTLLILAGCVLAVSSVAQAGLADGLVSYWPMDGNLNDAEGSNDGTFIGGGSPDYQIGQFGTGIDLPGEAYVHVPTDPSLDMSANDNVSMSVWFRVDAFTTQWQTLIGNDHAFRISRLGGTNEFEYHGGGDAILSGNINDGQIHHALVITAKDAGPTADGTYFWIDGTLVSMNPGTPIINPDIVSGLGIGADTQGTLYYYKGLIDDVAIWNRALTPAEVGAIYDGGVAGNSLAEVIPEPNSAVLAILGMLSFVLTARRRRRRSG